MKKDNKKRIAQKKLSQKCTNIGGQAVIEGVLMISPKKISVSARNPNGKIISKNQKNAEEKIIWLKIPFIRGVVRLFRMLIIGFKALNWSAGVAVDEEEGDVPGWIMLGVLILSIGFGLLLFLFLPLLLTQFLSSVFHIIKSNSVFFNLIDGSLKVGIFLLYILLISQMKDIKRIFQYHGAEHKVIHAYEKNLKLTLPNIKKQSTLHSRCGTSFILLVIMISIIIYIFIPIEASFLPKLGYRVLFLPFIAGISYEILKLGSKFEKNFIFKILVLPGIFLQKLTTREPDAKQIEVALESLKNVV